jgi:dienelactone hydrolase
LLDFYTLFLTALQEKDVTENLAIIAQAHIDHTPGIYQGTLPHSRHSLAAQVQSAIEFFDAAVAEFSPARVMLIGHSVGAWVALQASFTPVSFGHFVHQYPRCLRIAPTLLLACFCFSRPSAT